MAEETRAKKIRMDQGPSVNERSITLNMLKYNPWVQELPEEELVKIFEIGVLVRESLTMTVNSNRNYVEQLLASQMQPIQDKVSGIEGKVSNQVQVIQKEVTKHVSDNIRDMTNTVVGLRREVSDDLNNIRGKLVSSVDTVASKVQPLRLLNDEIKSSKNDVLAEVRKVYELVQKQEKPKIKGSIGERLVEEILREGLPSSFTIKNVASKSGGKSGDLTVTTEYDQKFLIEVKNHENSVSKPEIERFEEEVVDSPSVKVGIMFSLKSGIARRSSRRKFEIIQNSQNQYYIFVPNAMKEEGLMVWSVMLANELAESLEGLKDVQKKKLDNLYANFRDSIANAKKCRQHLETLETTMAALKENMEPILDIVVKSGKEMYEILHQNKTKQNTENTQ